MIRRRRNACCRTDPQSCIVDQVLERSEHFDGALQLALVHCAKHGMNAWKWIERERTDALSGDKAAIGEPRVRAREVAR